MGCCWPAPSEEENINLEAAIELAEFENVVVHQPNDLPVDSLEGSIVHELNAPIAGKADITSMATEEGNFASFRI
jgi:hypothetical protein